MAGIKTSNESAAAALALADLVRIVQGSANAKATVQQFKDFVCNGQLPFPSTQNASADANTLDDYEEGTFTPVLGDGTNNYTLSLAFGSYTKIGRFVHLQINCVWSSIGSAGAGQLRITGLPFTSGANSHCLAIGGASGLDYTATLNPIIASVGAASATIFFERVNDNAGATNLAANSSSATGAVFLCGGYTV